MSSGMMNNRMDTFNRQKPLENVRHLETILGMNNQDGRKALTLTSGGELTVVDLTRKTDGGVKRFFKGLGMSGEKSRTYKSQQLELRALQKTAKNPQFVASLQNRLIQQAGIMHLRSQGDQPEGMKFGKFLKIEMEKIGRNPVTPNDVFRSLGMVRSTRDNLTPLLGHQDFQIEDKKGTGSKNLVDFIKDNSTHEFRNDTAKTLKGAILQSIGVVMEKNMSDLGGGSVDKKIHNSCVSQLNGSMLKEMFLSCTLDSSEEERTNRSISTTRCITDMLKHLKGLVDEGRKNGLSDTEIANNLFDYIGTVYRESPPTTDPLGHFELGDSRCVPQMVKR